MFDLATIFGLAGTLTGTSALMPQLYKTYVTKSVEDLSWGALILLTLNCINWLMYGLLTHATPVIVTNVIALVVIILLDIFKVLYRNNP